MSRRIYPHIWGLSAEAAVGTFASSTDKNKINTTPKQMRMKFFAKLCISAILAAAAVASPSNAQTKATVSGAVVAADTKAPVAYALVHLPDAGLQAVTDNKGEFRFKAVSAGKHKVEVTFLGYEPLETVVTVKAGDNNVKLELQPANFRVEDVVVTAEAGKAGAATSSTISRTAIDHIQSTSLSDVMNLLPGSTVQSTDNLTLAQASTFSIRGGSSLGTAVIMDGTPLSNNSNMQNMTSAFGGAPDLTSALANGNAAMATPTSGVDMRQISTDNIESVEVIRGIASAEYGDITSGAVLVNTKAGRAPLQVKLTMNPNLYQVSATHGIQLGEKAGRQAGALNYSADYTFSQYKPTEGYSYYSRTNATVGYTNSIGRWYTNSTLSVGVYRDKDKPTPGYEEDKAYGLQKENRYRFNTKGTVSFDKGWFNNIKYAASFTLTDKHTYFEDMAINSEWSFSTSKTDGETLSSVQGAPIYMEDGSVLVDGTSPEKAWRSPNSYFYAYNIYGKELNTYAQVIANFAGEAGPTSHFIKLGADFKNDGNTGRGKVFDPDCPPQRNLSFDYSTQRERAYDDIPFMSTLGLFAEESFNLRFARRNLNVVAGVRYDKVFDFDGVVSPRINASLEIVPNKLFVRGGYGITAKTPTLAILYPQEAYFDLLNFNNAPSTSTPDAQKFQVITTRVFDTKNYDLEMATATKYEAGIDFKIGQVRGAFTVFKDRSDNGYTFSPTLDSYRSVDLVKYAVAELPEDGTTLPVLKEESTTPVLLSYAMPTNNAACETRGIEMSLDFGRIDAIRTRFILDGAWTRTETWHNGYSFRRASSGNIDDHMGVFADGVHNYREILSTNLKAVHNIPSIGFVISATANVVWSENAWQKFIDDEIPVKYISVADGKVYDFDESMFELDEFKAIDVRKELDVRRNIKDSYMSPLLCVNVNLTKEIKDYLRISFYANNAFRSTPLWQSTKTPGKFVRRNKDTFFFGLSLTAIIK